MDNEKKQISKELAKHIYICYEQKEYAEQMIEKINQNIEQQGAEYKIKDSSESQEIEPFKLWIKQDEKGSYRVIEAPATLALKMAKAIKKTNKKELKKLRIDCFTELGIAVIESKNMITKELACQIHNSYFRIDECKQFIENIKKEIQDGKEVKMELRESSFFSKATLLIPMTYSETSYSVNETPADISLEILENTLKNRIKEQEALNKQAINQLTTF